LEYDDGKSKLEDKGEGAQKISGQTLLEKRNSKSQSEVRERVIF
jgi:hypothetical protein